MLFGTDDYCFVADNDLLDFGAGDSFTVMAAVRQWGTFNSGRLVTKGNMTLGPSWGLSGDANSQPLFIPAGATSGAPFVYGPNRTAGTLHVIAAVRDTAADTVQTSVDGVGGTLTTDTTVGTLENTSALQIGRQPTGIYADFEFFGAAVFRRALSAAEIDAITDYFEAASPGAP